MYMHIFFFSMEQPSLISVRGRPGFLRLSWAFVVRKGSKRERERGWGGARHAAVVRSAPRVLLPEAVPSARAYQKPDRFLCFPR